MSNNSQPQDASRLANAPLGRLMLQLAVPTVLAQIVNLLYNMVDRIYVGRIPETGSIALAGLGVSFPIILLISAFAALVGQGGAPQASIAMGQQDYKKANRILGTSTAFLIVLAAVLFAVFWVIRKPVLMMFGASEATLPYADDYLKIYLLGTLSVQVSLGLNQFISCQGFAKTSMITVIFLPLWLLPSALPPSVCFIILDPVFIYGFNMGVKGAAWATIISQTVSALWVFLFLCSKKSILRLQLSNLRLDWNMLKPVLALGLSPFIMQATECLVQLTFNTGMQRYGNDYYVGAMTILFSVSQMLFLPMQGLAQGATPIISYNFGAGNPARVKKAFRLMAIASLAFSFCATGIILLFPRPFISMFSNDPEIIRIGSYGIRIYTIGFLFFGIQCACQQTFIALGQAKISMFLALLRKVILLIPLALILPTIGNLGTNGLFIAEPISDILSIITTLTLFLINIKKILAPISKPKSA